MTEWVEIRQMHLVEGVDESGGEAVGVGREGGASSALALGARNSSVRPSRTAGSGSSCLRMVGITPIENVQTDWLPDASVAAHVTIPSS